MLRKNLYLILICFCPFAFSCRIKEKQKHAEILHQRVSKPGSSFQDTMEITIASAVFYGPDSLQLRKIKAVTDKRIFEGTMHEYFYQQRNAHFFFKKYWQQLMVLDTRNIRYLNFVKSDKTSAVVDLDKVSDAYGLFVFDREKAPFQVDMTNIETQVPQYFTNQ